MRTRFTTNAAVDPWFVRRPRLTLLVALVLFAAVTVLRFARATDLATGIAMLYLLPVSLAAVARGRLAGLVGGSCAAAALAVWARVADVDVDLVGLAFRNVPLVLVGYLLGDAADRLRSGNEQRLLHEGAALRHRQAIEINDLLVQGMATAKWSFEAGRTEDGLRILEETIGTGQALVSRLIRDAGAGGRVMGDPARPPVSRGSGPSG
jgi:hypothetical protein